jgi:hypothetical protein
MKILELKNKNLDYKLFKHRSAEETDYDTLITESCIGVENGEIKFVYQALDFEPADLVEALKRIKYTESKRTDGLTTRSRVFGFKPRNTMRGDYCKGSSLAYDFPAEHKLVCEYAGKIEGLYQAAHPKGYAAHSEKTQTVKNAYRLGQKSIFTSGIINKNNPLKYHFDTGNFKAVYSCMLVFKEGVKGGYLALPEYGVGIQLVHNSIFMFDGQSIMHGVTPITMLHPHSYRYSVVYYSLQQLWKCLEIDDELARIRNVKRQRELKRATMSDETKAQYRADYGRKPPKIKTT